MNSTVDGPGIRVSLFVSGCRNHCPGCFNKDTWDFNYGKPFTSNEENEILAACAPKHIKGLSILGGEPLEPENQAALLTLINRFKDTYHGKSLWIYTGYILERDLLPGQRKYVPTITDRILESVDMLVDGPFILEQRDLTLQFRGSRNQRLIPGEEIRKMLT